MQMNPSILALAGGGNRCWWQAGVLARLMREGWTMPRQLVGTSAGAAIAAACLTIGPEAALDACRALYGRTARIFHWRGLLHGRLEFAHQTVYPAWLDAFVNEQTFATLRASGSSLRVAVTRPARYLGLTVSVSLGTLAYLVDKKIWHGIHPRLPAALGLTQELIDVTQCDGAADAHRILMAAAAPPPIVRAVPLHGRHAFDGGYFDNAPLPRQTLPERRQTWVMLTRHYPDRPAFFRCRDRSYWQPSRPVPVSTWDCTRGTTVGDAFRLGFDDAEKALRSDRSGFAA
ncbi:patatin [Burkholderia cepacia]|uniref:Patatin n=2 Tax=Burkholderia cepacia TaxID=292 RepID=A0A103ZEM3_BURCE|nr:patatin [Burkholderia cepacia]